MTDRHIHCVYFQYNNIKSVEGYCLLKNKKIEHGFKPHCKNWVLRPHMLISYYLKHEGYCGDWECADKKALEYLDRIGFNTYPKIQKNDDGDKDMIKNKKITIELIDAFELLAETGSTHEINEFCNKYHIPRKEYDKWWNSKP